MSARPPENSTPREAAAGAQLVLIVEDDPAILRGLKDSFEFEGYRTRTAIAAFEAKGGDPAEAGRTAAALNEDTAGVPSGSALTHGAAHFPRHPTMRRRSGRVRERAAFRGRPK